MQTIQLMELELFANDCMLCESCLNYGASSLTMIVVFFFFYAISILSFYSVMI